MVLLFGPGSMMTKILLAVPMAILPLWPLAAWGTAIWTRRRHWSIQCGLIISMIIVLAFATKIFHLAASLHAVMMPFWVLTFISLACNFVAQFGPVSRPRS